MIVSIVAVVYVGCIVGRVAAVEAEIDTPSKRSRLTSRKNPYWQGVSGGRGGVSLGYRKPQRGAGTWIAKVVVEGDRAEERIGLADDDGAGSGALAYRAAVAAALTWSRQQYAMVQGRRERNSATRGPTVRSAVEDYIAARKTRDHREGMIAEGRLTNYVLSDNEFANTPLAKLRVSVLDRWRSRLPVRDQVEADADQKVIAPSTLNRILNDLRAALNAAAEKHRQELPASVASEIKVGTRAVSISGDARKQLLTDEQTRRLVEAAFQQKDDGDFGRLVMLAAATGARFSQLAKLRVADVQPERNRIMVPASKKGRGSRHRPHISVQVVPLVVERLEPCLTGRAPDEPLLMRWAYKSVGPLQWERDYRRPWRFAYEVEKPWAATVVRAGLPAETIVYAFRHSSIVRGLRAGLPVRLVAALHDTSGEMIERHYSAYIIDATEELARRAVLSL